MGRRAAARRRPPRRPASRRRAASSTRSSSATRPGTRWPQTYGFNGCVPDDGQDLLEGMSVGWGDTYDYWRHDQWVDRLGPNAGQLAGRRVRAALGHRPAATRSTRAPSGADTAREATTANDAIALASGSTGGALVDERRADRHVTLDDVASRRADTVVRLRALGRDDVSGVEAFRVSNNGRRGPGPSRSLPGRVGSTPSQIDWNLADRPRRQRQPRDEDGVRPVPRPHPANGARRRPTRSTWPAPAARQRLLERRAQRRAAAATGASARRSGDARPSTRSASNDGWYYNAPALGAPSLLGTELGQRPSTSTGRMTTRTSARRRTSTPRTR